MSATRDILDDYRLLEADRDKLLPPLVCWPQLLIWIARRDGDLAREFDADKDAPQREYALCQILRATLARGKADSPLDRSYDADADREAVEAEEAAYAKMRAPVDPLTALAKCTASQPLEQDTLYAVRQSVWNEARIRPHSDAGTVATRATTYTAIRFTREDVLRLWPPRPHRKGAILPKIVQAPLTKAITDDWARRYIAQMDAAKRQPTREQMRKDALADGLQAKHDDIRDLRKKYAAHWRGRGRKPGTD